MSAIEFRNVTKRFGQVTALEEVNLAVKAGEFVSLIGPSGCGKTTMLRVVAGLEDATGGMVAVNGHPPAVACREHQVGVAFQRPALVESRTALNNVKLTLEITGKQNSLPPDQLLRDFGLGDFLHHYPHQLSGGMQQRVNIAAALVHNPPILLMDEPFGALDELTRETMAEWLGGVLQRSAKTVLFVTHSVEEATILSDRWSSFPRDRDASPKCSTSIYPNRGKAIRTHVDFLQEVARVREALYRAIPGEGSR
ncbi:MAG: ATP-binding cassette domain-containing protein [Caldilineaceae bacterium]